MNTTYRKVPTRFSRPTRFAVQPTQVAPFRAVKEARFEQLKRRLLLTKLDQLPDTRTNAQLRRAANDAAALAWLTPYPTLLFPVLFDEKARTGLDYARRQRRVRERSPRFLAA